MNKVRSKAEIKEFIELAFKADGVTEDEIIWLRHAVKGLFEYIFEEQINVPDNTGDNK